MEPRRRLPCAPLAVALVAVLCAGCASLPFRLPFTAAGFERNLSREELSDELDAYATRFGGLVSTAAEEIAATSDDPMLRRRTLLWTRSLPPAVNEAAFMPNPQAGYVRALTVAVMMNRYLSVGDGRRLFGSAQPIATGVAEILEENALAIGGRFLTPAELTKVSAEVDSLAERFPIQGTQFSLVRARQAAEAVPTSNVLTEVISLPLAPFRALQGVDSGAAAVRDFNHTARRFATIVAALPEDLRVQMQLLMLDTEETRAVRQGLAAFELAAASAERASLAMERLPADLRATLDEELRSVLAESEGAVGQAAQVVSEARGLAGPLQETATQLRDASALWREILGPSKPPGPDDRPFDVREWESAARAIGTSAVELRGLASELDGFSASAGLDRLFWRAIALLVVFFALLLVYRVLSARLVARG